MSQDILHRLCGTSRNPDIQFTPNMCNEALVVANKALVQLEMVAPNRSAYDFFDRDLQREMHFDVDVLSIQLRTKAVDCINYMRQGATKLF